MSCNRGEVPKWVVVELHDGEEVEAYPVRGKTPQSAFRRLSPLLRQRLDAGGYRVEPFPDRLQVRSRLDLRFEIPGVEGEDRYRVEVHECRSGVGFQYRPILETRASLERLAPLPDVQQLARVVTRIFEELGLRPRRLVLGVKEAPGIGPTGYGGLAIVGQGRFAYIELEVVHYPLAMLDYWEGILWHEAMHVRYVFEKRWPTVWPFYDPSTIGPVLALDCLLHFSIDGWLERHDKPTIHEPPPDQSRADLKATRLWEFRQLASREGYHIDEDTLGRVVESLWGWVLFRLSLTHLPGLENDAHVAHGDSSRYAFGRLPGSQMRHGLTVARKTCLPRPNAESHRRQTSKRQLNCTNVSEA